LILWISIEKYAYQRTNNSATAPETEEEIQAYILERKKNFPTPDQPTTTSSSHKHLTSVTAVATF